MTTLPARTETVIVGAGQAGLTMSWYLQQAGRGHDREPVGEVGPAGRLREHRVVHELRHGAQRELAGEPGLVRPQRVVYVSCNPRALARDLQLAEAFPYAIDTVQPVDMFPHTAHVETVVTLINRES